MGLKVAPDFAEDEALQLVSKAMMEYLNRLCIRARECCEHSGRSQTNLLDAQQALTGVGIRLSHLAQYIHHHPPLSTRVSVSPQPPPQTPSATLKVGESMRIVHAPHIPNFLPPLPDPHTYMRTEVSGEVESSYEHGRELAAVNRRNTENALQNYMLSISPSTSVFRRLEEDLMLDARREVEMQDDDPFTPKETEKSIIRKYIPAWCQILLPTDDESRPPYLSALLNEEEIAGSEEDKSNYFASILNKEIEDDDGDDAMMDTTAPGGDADQTILSFLNRGR